MTLSAPCNIEFLLWCHTRCEPYPRLDLTMYQQLVETLLNGGIIVRMAGTPKGTYTTTNKGRAWVELLCNTPEPREAFVDAQGNVIKV